MLSTRWATVVATERLHRGLVEVTVEIDGEPAPALAYDALVQEPLPGERVLVNTTAVELGLGTGGHHLVIAVEGRDAPAHPGGHAMKLRYAPHQLSVDAVEDAHGPAIDAVSLANVPVVVAPLHSLLAPVALGVAAAGPGLRCVYVMSDGAALPLALSTTVPALAGTGLLAATITAGQAFGGDLEAVNVTSALAAARAVSRADVVVVAMGPGNLGTASKLGFAGLEVGAHVNAASSLGADPIAVPRISGADPRDRHRGLSHHTVTALGVSALARATIALPSLPDDLRAAVERDLEPLRARHDVVTVDRDLVPILDGAPVPLVSMGRTPADDPTFFAAGVAAGIIAAERVRG